MELEINLGTKIGEISAKEILTGTVIQTLKEILKKNSYEHYNLRAIGEAGTFHTLEVYGCSLLQVHSNFSLRALMDSTLQIVEK